MPSAELVTTELAAPFEGGDAHGYVDFVGLGYDPLYWVSDELAPWRLRFDRSEDFITVAARRSEAIAARESYSQHRDDVRWPLTYRLHEYLERDLALWTASQLLLAFHSRLSSIRDHDLRPRRLQPPSRRLRTIKDELLTDATDARLAAAELERFAEDEERFKWNACDWELGKDFPGNERIQLLESFRLTVQENAAALTGVEERLRDALIVESSVVGTRAGLRINWWMMLITLVALLIAIASLIVASNSN